MILLLLLLNRVMARGHFEGFTACPSYMGSGYKSGKGDQGLSLAKNIFLIFPLHFKERNPLQCPCTCRQNGPARDTVLSGGRGLVIKKVDGMRGERKKN